MEGITNSQNYLKTKLRKCKDILSKGYDNRGFMWLNDFCTEFLELMNSLHKFISSDFGENEAKNTTKACPVIETIYVCLIQILCCIKNLERSIKAEKAAGIVISAARQHFLDRINWCLKRLHSCCSASKQNYKNRDLEDNSYMDLMDLVFDDLAPYSCYEYQQEPIKNVAEENAEAMFSSKQIRVIVDQILSHTLAFANVALKEDKFALSALCQKVLRECIAFQEECELNLQNVELKQSNRKLKASCLENALYQLEDYVNEALLRLVYTCFMDFERFSIENLRSMIAALEKDRDQVNRMKGELDETSLDEFIADFDVNIDRITQIGIFAISFAPTIKVKTVVRSALASFESLDACIIPSLQTKSFVANIYSEILEQHFNEEVTAFKKAIQEIIDSYAFTVCYCELLQKCIVETEKEFNKHKLQEIVQMGNFLKEHFDVAVNFKELQKKDTKEALKLYDKFKLILKECQAILMCAEQVDKNRILKRFKILCCIVCKMAESLKETPKNENQDQTDADIIKDNDDEENFTKQVNRKAKSDDWNDSQKFLESFGITPSRQSVLYGKQTKFSSNQQDNTKSNVAKQTNCCTMLKPKVPENYSENADGLKDLNAKTSSAVQQQKQQQQQSIFRKNVQETTQPYDNEEIKDFIDDQTDHASQLLRRNIRRRESLRTAMFKRQKTNESQKAYSIYRESIESLQISEILDQLSDMSLNLSKEDNQEIMV